CLLPMLPCNSRSTLFPYTTLFRSVVHKIFIGEDAYYKGASETKEFYMSVLLDRTKECNAVVYSAEGGMDIEEVAEHTPEKIFKRSEEHTSELQSRRDIVCRLLLEK